MTETLIQGIDKVGDSTVVKVQGEIDYSNSPELRVALIQVVSEQPRKLVIDLSAVQYLDSSGLATLVEILQTQSNSGGKLTLCGLQSKVQGIIEIARLDAIFTITTTLDEAVKA